MDPEFSKWYAHQESKMMDEHAASTLKYVSAVKQLVREYQEATGGDIPKGISWTQGKSKEPAFSEENPLKLITASEDYIEARFVDGSYYGFNGEAYNKLIEITNRQEIAREEVSE